MNYELEEQARELIDALIEVEAFPGSLSESNKGRHTARVAAAIGLMKRRVLERNYRSIQEICKEAVDKFEEQRAGTSGLANGSTCSNSQAHPQSGQEASSGSPPSSASAAEGANRLPQVGHDHGDSSLE